MSAHLMIAEDPQDDVIRQVGAAVMNHLVDKQPVKLLDMGGHKMIEIANGRLRSAGSDALGATDEPHTFPRDAELARDVGIATLPVNRSPLLPRYHAPPVGKLIPE